MTRYIALIPAYEPDRRLLTVMADLGKEGFDVVVVDDGSNAAYSDIFEQAAEHLPGKTGHPPILLIHDINKGKGAALKTGLEFIGNYMVTREEASNCVVVCLDADGQHLACDAVRCAREAGREPGTMILGSRAFAGNEVPLRSRLGNSITRQVFRLATGTSIYDTQTGLRAFTADLIPYLLKVDGDRYEYELNVLMNCSNMGIPVREVGIETVYTDGNSSSHFDTVRDSARIYKEIAGYMMRGHNNTNNARFGNSISAGKQAAGFSASSFVSFLIDYGLYALLLMLGTSLVAANIAARLVSATINFTINRRLVFRSNKSLLQSAVEYAALAAMILTGNTVVLNTLVTAIGLNTMAAKIITEIMFFIISWTVQKYVVFYTDAEAAGDSKRARGSLMTARGSGNSAMTGGAEIEYSSSANADDPCGRATGGRFQLEYSAVRPKRLRSAYRREQTGA